MKADSGINRGERIGSDATGEVKIQIQIQGNKRLKNLLIFSCNCLARTDGRWGEYYARCRGRGMPHDKALKAVARKRLKVIYAVMRDKVSYVAWRYCRMGKRASPSGRASMPRFPSKSKNRG